MRERLKQSLAFAFLASASLGPSPCVSSEHDSQPFRNELIRRLPPAELQELPSYDIRQPRSAINGPLIPKPTQRKSQVSNPSPLAQPVRTPSTEPKRPVSNSFRVPQAISFRAEKLVADGVALAERRAFFSSRDEFIGALRIIAQSLDEQAKSGRHMESLSLGLRAVKEAGDLVPRRGGLDADVALDVAVSAHRTPVLKQSSLENVSPLSALQAYYGFAHERLAEAVGSEPAASKALLGLGKLYMVQALPEGSADDATAMLMFKAALDVAPNNADAANELGVLYARYGQMNEARDTLLQSVRARPTPAAWQNLALIHERLGETELAQLARVEQDLTAAQAPTASQELPRVSWVTPEAFKGQGAGRTELGEARRTPQNRRHVRPQRRIR